MSFSLTTQKYEDRSKTVTRRLGWKNLKPGEVFMGIEKGQGLKKGEKVKRLHPSRCISNRPERLDAITEEDCVKEGFPEYLPTQFVVMFCQHNNCMPDQIVNRIEFEHLE